MLSDAVMATRRHRIQLLCNMETISRKVTDAILGLESSMRQAMAKVV